MTEEEKASLREQATNNAQKIVDGLAPLYLGRTCPLKTAQFRADGTENWLARECDGPRCQLFAPMNEDPEHPNRITGGACCIPLAVSQVPQLVQALQGFNHAAENLALAAGPRILRGTT